MVTTSRHSPSTFDSSAALARFSVRQYHAMIETGILTTADRVELLENHVVLKMPRNAPHDGAIDLTSSAIPPLQSGWLLRSRQTVRLTDSQPEPDFAIVRGHPRTYLTRHPEAADVELIIEIADSSLLRDQLDKGRIYARANIPMYWIVNIPERCLEIYTQPDSTSEPPAYTSVQRLQSGEAASLILDGVHVKQITVDDILP